jgi:predicted 3-demethylubiquinone-9 3-methyltransferase (glyoxalase superfamily)
LSDNAALRSPEPMTGDPQRANRVMEAMMQMKKVDIARLEAAFNG